MDEGGGNVCPITSCRNNLAQQQYADNIVAALNKAQHLEQERQCGQNNHGANHNPVPQEQAATDKH